MIAWLKRLLRVPGQGAAVVRSAHGDHAAPAYFTLAPGTDLIPGHLLVVGGEGVGKSYAIAAQLAEAARAGHHVIAIGRRGELNLVAERAGREGALLSLGPLEARQLGQLVAMGCRRAIKRAVHAWTGGAWPARVLVVDLSLPADCQALIGPTLQALTLMAWEHAQATLRTRMQQAARLILAIDPGDQMLSDPVVKEIVLARALGRRGNTDLWLTVPPEALATAASRVAVQALFEYVALFGCGLGYREVALDFARLLGLPDEADDRLMQELRHGVGLAWWSPLNSNQAARWYHTGPDVDMSGFPQGPHDRLERLAAFRRWTPAKAYREVLNQDAALTTRAMQEPFEKLWPDCEQFLACCDELLPRLSATDRRMVRAIRLFWATYQYRQTGVFISPRG